MVNMSDTLSAQVGVLGSMLIEPALVGEVLSKVREDDFLSGKCRLVFQAFRSLFTAGEAADAISVRAKLGGPADGEWSRYLQELMELTPTARNVWEYVRLMKEQAQVAKLNELGGLLTACTDMDKGKKYISQLNALLSERPGIQRMNMEQLLVNFYERQSQEHVYLSWGLNKLDDRLYAELGDMIVVGGYPSAGKTALAVAFAWHMAREYRVGFYSLETNQYKLADRLIANLAGIDLSAIKQGQISEEEWARLAELSPHIRPRKLDLIPAGGMTVEDIQADALSRRYQIVFVDYLQLIVSRGYNRQEEVARTSVGLHQLAQSNGITVVALSQLSRPDRKGEDEVAPTMASLRESGQIEQDADAIMLLYLEEPKRPTESRRVLRIAKNKEGERGLMYLVFDGEHQRFRESAIEGPAPEAEPAHRKKPPAWWRKKYDGDPIDDPWPNEKIAGT